MLMVEMGTFLSELLGATEPLFTLAVKQLEDGSGRPGADVRLIAEVVEKSHTKMRQLDLDPRDTTGRELYQTLKNKVELHDALLAKKLGCQDAGDVNTLLPLIKKAAEAKDVNRQVWVLKKSVAKRLLHDNPPPVIMKHLHHSSVDSMLKRENLFEVYGAIRFAESTSWLTKFTKTYKRLQPSDFELRDIEILQLSQERWGDLAESEIRKNRHILSHLKELGVIILLPPKHERMPGLTLTTLPLLFHYINEIRLYSAFFKLQQVKPGFGKIIADTLLGDANKTAIMAGSHVHWRVIQRYFGNLEDEKHPEIFEPHVQPEDLYWRKAEEHLYDLDPEFGFWQGLDYVGISSDGAPVSFNLLDNATSFFIQAPYEHRVISHMRGSLWNELFVRYMGEANLESQVLKQLDNDMIMPERLKVR